MVPGRCQNISKDGSALNELLRKKKIVETKGGLGGVDFWYPSIFLQNFLWNQLVGFRFVWWLFVFCFFFAKHGKANQIMIKILFAPN